MPKLSEDTKNLTVTKTFDFQAWIGSYGTYVARWLVNLALAVQHSKSLAFLTGIYQLTSIITQTDKESTNAA